MTIAKTVAVLDACVLYPPALRDLLMHLASFRVYAPRYTEQIHDEWVRNVLAKGRLAEGRTTLETLTRTRSLMNQITPEPRLRRTAFGQPTRTRF